MFEQNLACIRTHRNNIHRYRRLLLTELSDLERGFIVMSGSECSRGGARYKAERALFLLLCASASRFPKSPTEPSDFVGRPSRRSKDTGTSETLND